MFLRTVGYVALLLALSAHIASAQTTAWVGTVGDWSDPANWTGGVVPDSEYLAIIDNGGTAQVSSTAACARLLLGPTVGTIGTLEITDGVLANDSWIDVGSTGMGVVRQTGGNHVASSVLIGVESTGDGEYRLGGGNLLSVATTVGGSGAGIFVQTGGHHDAQTLQVDGSYLMVDGLLEAVTCTVNGQFALLGSAAEVDILDALSFASEAELVLEVGSSGLTAMSVGTAASLGDATLTIVDSGASPGLYWAISAGDLNGTFATVNLPSDAWSWEIDAGDVILVKTGSTSTVEMTWGEVKGSYR